ncbi:MAG: hypothetical protein F4201_04430 [Nitrospira sp. SB0677_bin_15]|nr:hypothetical protein [Nitrospira sp. SB0667_bin_9]MYD31788.1 hypothetical protein [Nitrospira sp. SB0661_bin_20]MYG40052.1 hypothetical protein [Nitrospira sp. SB0677_bin_15]MYH03069.1 hypothetical protein [Nitrospira sp. SB0675_bin_23]
MWVLSVGCLSLTMLISHAFVAQRAENVALAQAMDQDVLNLTSLNIRMSQRAIHPPKHLVKAVVELPRVQAARARIAPSPKSAVLEDDNHNRALILSVLDDDRLQVHVLDDLDFAQHVPFVTACAKNRGCAFDRRPITGGLGCVAICIQRSLDPSREP